MLGAVGKLLATSITYPYITIKSRMHVKEGTKEGMAQAVNRVVQEEGWSGLYKGMACSTSCLFPSQLPFRIKGTDAIPIGIGPKVTQSVITAAFLFAFKDALYEASVKLRRRVPAQLPGK